jgi:hypothetical protein
VDGQRGVVSDVAGNLLFVKITGEEFTFGKRRYTRSKFFLRQGL